jgi:hypothetical protein
MGGFLNDPTDTSAPSGVTMYTDLHWNTLFSCSSSSNLTNWFNAGLSLMAQNNELFNAQGSAIGTNDGILFHNGIGSGPFNSGIAKCIISMCITDEPAYVSCWSGPIGGTTTDNVGTITSAAGALTNAMIDGRPFWSNMAGFSWIITCNRGTSPSNSTQISQVGTLASPTPMNTVYPTLNTTTRNPFDLTGSDAYYIPIGRYASYWGLTLANAAEGQFTATPFTMLECSRGSHQGIWIDYFRNFCTANLSGTAGYTRPLGQAIPPGCNAVSNIPGFQGMQETNWECWSVIIHGGRYLIFFDHDDQTALFNRSRSSGFMQPSGAPGKGTLLGADTKLNQTVTFTGQINASTKVLTVTGITASTVSLASGSPGGMYLHPGMEITSINGVTQSPPVVIQTQLTFNNEGTFTGVLTGNGSVFGAPFDLLGVSGLSGFIPVPSILVAPGTGGLGPSNHNSGICGQESGTVNGNGGYTVLNGGPSVSSASGWTAWAPGLNGTYQVSGGVAASPVTMIAKQSDVRVLGTNTTNAGTGNYYNQVAQTCGRILDMAPVINSQFAVGTKAGTNGFVLPTSTSVANGVTVPFRYIFPYGVISGALQPVPHPYGDGIGTSQARAFFLQQGIDCCVHYYQGPTYTSRVSGESITTNTFYIIATTSYQEDTLGGISATFNTALTSATTVTVIGEGRTVPISGGSFTDNFAYPWTVHIYKIT